MKSALIMVALLLVLWQMGFVTTGPDLKVELSENSFVSIERGKFYTEYDLLDQVYASSYRVVNFDKAHSSNLDIGVTYFLSVLSDEQYRKFLEVKKVSCPAGFLNGNATNYLLVVGDDKKDMLRNLNLETGDRINFIGRNLKTAYMEINGHEVQNFTLQGAQPVWVDKLEEMKAL
jgi:hypothetical protein